MRRRMWPRMCLEHSGWLAAVIEGRKEFGMTSWRELTGLVVCHMSQQPSHSHIFAHRDRNQQMQLWPLMWDGTVMLSHLEKAQWKKRSLLLKCSSLRKFNFQYNVSKKVQRNAVATVITTSPRRPA